jgi:hypothetical protein
MSVVIVLLCRSDPRQDPILGPLLAELDEMTNQKVHVPPTSSILQRPPISYESNLIRTTGLSQTATLRKTFDI